MAKKAKRASKSAGKSRRKSTGKPARKSASKPRKTAAAAFPGMMGDGTEEQNLNQRGNPGARIRKRDVVAAFRKKRGKKRA